MLFIFAGFRFTIYLRIKKFLKTKNKLLYNVARLYLRQMSYKFGIDMYDSTVLGKGFYIGHFGGIVINGGTQFGDNVNISQGVTIGRIKDGKHMGTPVIEDNVWIGANTVIVGGIIIGANSTIAPCSFVNFNVPENSLVMGSPGKIVKENYINRNINNTV